MGAMHRLLTGPLSIERLTVDISGLPDHLDGRVIVQLSDLHFDGVKLSNTLLEEAIAQSNAIAPDLVVLTGDLVTDDPTPIDGLADYLRQFQSRYGTYAALGNHDNAFPGARQSITQALESAGVPVLWNEIAYPFGPGLALVGLADFWSRDFNPAPVFAQLEEDAPRIVLSHNPDSAVRLASWRVDLQLSGHTHGGQIVLPGLGPFPTLYQRLRRYVPKSLRRYIPYMQDECHKVVKHWEWAQGLHSVGSNWLYVNRGLGTFPPGRLFCPPELTVITLAAKPCPQSSTAQSIETVALV